MVLLAPKGTVGDVQVVPITTTSVRVNWKPIGVIWNGDMDTGGYRVFYRQIVDYPVASVQSTPKEEIHGTNAKSVVLTDLTRDKNYEITVAPFNSRGEGDSSRPITVYVGEAVPTGEPRDVVVKAASSTDIQIEWKAPFQNQQNGDLLGYKVRFFTCTFVPILFLYGVDSMNTIIKKLFVPICRYIITQTVLKKRNLRLFQPGAHLTHCFS